MIPINPTSSGQSTTSWLIAGGFPDTEMPADELVSGAVRPESRAIGMVGHGFLFELPRDVRDGIALNRQAGMN
ncbi:MAG: hypothetical protein QGI63_06105 [Rhodospirillales bacterium]|mgnify:CR=1 FL=1|nr:hypothetical protein [Rhodospirillales bacterium]MDP6773825.1 hypothetical protein [Rhodospirillales bacterium]